MISLPSAEINADTAIFKALTRNGEMPAQVKKAFATKPDDLRSILETRMVKGSNQLPPAIQ